MRMTRKSLLGLAAGAGAAVALSGCGSNSDSSGSGGKLQFYLSGDANQGGGYASMVQKYQEETGTEIEIVDIAYDDLATKIKNAAQANDLPALARVPSIDSLWKDQLVDLKSVVDGSNVMQDFVTMDGDVALSLPSDITAVGLYLNKTLWDQAGVEWPTGSADIWTWDDFVDRAKQVQTATGCSYGMVMDRSSHRLKAFLYEFGSTWWQATNDVYSTNDATKTGLEYFKSLNDDTFMPKSVWVSRDDPNTLFKSGQVAAYYSGSWQIADFDANISDFEWVSVYLPHQPVRTTQYGTAAEMVVFDGTGQEDAAKDFLAWLYTDENYKQLCEYSSMLPAVENISPEYSANQDAFELYNDEIANSAPIVRTIHQQEAELEVEGITVDGDPAHDETVKYINDEQDVDTTISNISDLLTEALNN